MPIASRAECKSIGIEETFRNFHSYGTGSIEKKYTLLDLYNAIKELI
jgi:hypothetical protein